MKYAHIVEGEFLERPNRFIAYVRIQGRQETVHVKNTGRCGELLVPGARVYLERSDRAERKTLYDLVAVEKGTLLVNMDSQAPNKAVGEWLFKRTLFPDLVRVRPETVYGKSRFDFYLETAREKIFLEVKGVTLEEKGVVRFPDAPSERAVKHIEELIEARKQGYQVYLLFVIQMDRARVFLPNWETHPEFGRALCLAARSGVQILAYNCRVTADSMEIWRPVPVRLDEDWTDEVSEARPDGLAGETAAIRPDGLAGETAAIRPDGLAGDAAAIKPDDLLEAIPGPLLSWYDENRRILPWREQPTPYHVWVSEIMLQQTRVEAVKPYYERFMARLPDIDSLSEVPEEELLKLWEGLGYYNRARNLRKAAAQVMEKYDGRMPDTYEELLGLKGIGSYTAGAIASIAFGRPVAAVDGNVLRVVSRVRMDESIIDDAKVKTRVEQELNQMIPRDRPGDFNQSMMELGACVCVPNGAPHCENCPLSSFCKAHVAGRELDFPKRAAKRQRSVEEKTVLVLRDGNRAALCKRSDKGLLAGMYELPSLEGHQTAQEVAGYLAENGIHVLRIQPLAEAKHIFTHKEWHMWGYMVRVDELAPRNPSSVTENWFFVEPEEIQEKYPIPSAFSAYAGYLNVELGNDKFEGSKLK